MVSEFEARRQIVEIGRRIWQRGYVASNDGNLSIRLDGSRILITPTGRSKGFMKPEELTVVDLAGTKLSGGPDPSSELSMHLFAYARRPDVGAIVHAHPPRSTAFAVAGIPLAQCVLPEVILTLGKVPLTSYATPSTEEVPQSIDEFIGSFNALLLRNHGVLTLGRNIEEAYFRLETVEHFADITLSARILGGASPLTREEVQKLLKVREKLELPETPAPCSSCGACESESASPAAGDPPATGASDSPARDADEEIVKAVIREVERALGKQ
jgi:L-fuculose-phosphate aldolase